MSDIRPTLIQPRSGVQLEAVRAMATSGFDADIWHVMEQRDTALIAEEVLHGPGSSKFVYSFDVQGKPVQGISVVGARHLASHYGGMKHRLVAATQKTGALFRFTSYPAAGSRMEVSCAVIAELANEPDFYGCVVEVQDIKSGNTIQAERAEERWGARADGSGRFERPNYATIAQSKAYRNAVLALIPQDIQLQWKAEMVKLGKSEIITDSVIGQKRTGILQFAAKKAIPIDRRALEDLTFAQIAGLAEAARVNESDFRNSLVALGLATAEPEEAKPASTPAKGGGGGKKRAQLVSGGDPRDRETSSASGAGRDDAGKPASSSPPEDAGAKPADDPPSSAGGARPSGPVFDE